MQGSLRHFSIILGRLSQPPYLPHAKPSDERTGFLTYFPDFFKSSLPYRSATHRPAIMGKGKSKSRAVRPAEATNGRLATSSHNYHNLRLSSLRDNTCAPPRMRSARDSNFAALATATRLGLREFRRRTPHRPPAANPFSGCQSRTHARSSAVR